MKHQWEENGRKYEVTEATTTFAEEGCPPVLLSNHRPLRKEILRLAGRVEELELCLKQAARDGANILGQQQTAAARYVRAEAENALLRRERALLVDLEKARATIIHGLLDGAVPASVVARVAWLNDEVAALHLEASGGIERPQGSACACILCRSEDDQKQVRQEVQLGGSAGQETCTACGEERETFEGRCHDCISSHRRAPGEGA